MAKKRWNRSTDNYWIVISFYAFVAIKKVFSNTLSFLKWNDDQENRRKQNLYMRCSSLHKTSLRKASIKSTFFIYRRAHHLLHPCRRSLVGGCWNSLVVISSIRLPSSPSSYVRCPLTAIAASWRIFIDIRRSDIDWTRSPMPSRTQISAVGFCTYVHLGDIEDRLSTLWWQCCQS